jgi:hypothetical protein
MSRSVLLQLARDSIEEVLQAQNSINKEALLQEHPLLNQKIATSVKLYIGNELRGFYENKAETKSLLYEIIINAKKAAFEDKTFSPMSTSEYLSCEIELTLMTEDGPISEKDKPILA